MVFRIKLNADRGEMPFSASVRRQGLSHTAMNAYDRTKKMLSLIYKSKPKGATKTD